MAGGAVFGVGKHCRPLGVQRRPVGRVFQPDAHLDDVVRRAAGGFDDFADMVEHDRALRLDGVGDGLAARIAAHDDPGGQQIADHRRVGDGVLVAEPVDMDALASAHGCPNSCI